MDREASLQRIAAWIQQEEDELQYAPDCGEADRTWNISLAFEPPFVPIELRLQAFCAVCGGTYAPGDALPPQTTAVDFCPHLSLKTTSEGALSICAADVMPLYRGLAYLVIHDVDLSGDMPMLDASEE